MEINKNYNSTTITTELEHLFDILNGNTRKLEDIIRIFINETPLIFDKIEQCIQQEAWKDAISSVHKVKARYAYLGLNDLMKDLSLWEDNLALAPKSVDHFGIINCMKRINDDLVKELKKTRFYYSMQNKVDQTLPLKGKLVLIAEDDEVNAMVFELFIKETGASVIIATDGNKALKVTYEKMPDMIFMDVHMPFFSGLDTIKELRSKGINCPIVSLSASTRLNERQNSLDSGADDFLIKPANRESITNALIKYLS